MKVLMNLAVKIGDDFQNQLKKRQKKKSFSVPGLNV